MEAILRVTKDSKVETSKQKNNIKRERAEKITIYIFMFSSKNFLLDVYLI